MTKPVASSDLDLQVFKEMRKVREAMYLLRLSLNVDFPELLADHEL